MKKNKFIFIFLIGLIFSCKSIPEHPVEKIDTNVVIPEIEILDYGIYEGDRLGSVRAEGTSLGNSKVYNANTIKIIEKTTRIPAEIGKSFGIRYVFRGTPPDTNIEHTIKVITPGLIKPPEPEPEIYDRHGRRRPPRNAAKPVSVEQWQAYAELGEPTYNGFGFEHEWEVVPGTWTFQILYKDRMLAEKSFEIYSVPKDEVSENLSAPVRKVIEYLKSSNCLDRLRAVYMVKVLGREAAPALPYLIKNLEKYSYDNQLAFDCGCAKETPSAIAAIGDVATGPLIEKLSDDQWTMQAGAEATLMLIGETAVDPLINEAKNGRHLDTRRQAITILGNFKNSRRIAPALIELLKDYFPEIRYALLEALQKLNEPVPVTIITDVLTKDREVGIRRKAAELLGDSKDQATLQALIDVYKNTLEDWFVREAALLSLVKIAEPAYVAPLIEDFSREDEPLIRKSILQALSTRDDINYARILCDRLIDPDHSVRTAALEGLIKNKNSNEFLRTALNDRDDKLSMTALFELARRNDASALRLLPEILKDINTYNRLEAAVILADIKDGRAFEALMEVAKLKDPGIKNATVNQKVAGSFGSGNPAREAEEENQRLAVRAIHALGILGDSRALGIINEAMTHQNTYIAEAALEALGMMPYPESISYLIEYIAQGDKPRIYEARNSLIRIGELSVTPMIESLRKEKGMRLRNIQNEFKYIMREIGKPSITYLAKALKDKNPAVKRYAIEALSLLKAVEAVKPMVNALYDKDAQVRSYAESYLKDMGAQAVKRLLPLMNEKDPVVRLSALRILGTLGEERALDPLLKALGNDKLRSVASEAIEPLGGIKHSRALKTLIQLLKDDNSNIRHHAINALGSMGDNQAVTPLLELLETEKDINMLNRIINSLSLIGDKNASQKIIVFLNHDNSQTRIQAATALLKIAAPDSVAALVNALGDKESIVRDYSYKALKEITKIDCGFYPDAWRLWLERNKIPEA
ncbi:MAG: DUF3859 domain-containing protein [Nitrospirota bacterium]